MENVKVVQLDTKEALTSLKELRNLLKAFKDEMARLEEGSDEFLEVANKAGELKHLIDEISQSVNGASADFGDILGNATKVTTGLIGGFQAAKGAMTLFGVESEEVTKAIQKMQASMAIIQGLSSIDAGIKALAKLRSAITSTTVAAKALRAAMTPKAILALTAAITVLVGVWKQFGGSIEKALPFITKIKEAFQETGDAAEVAAQKQEDYLKRVAEAQGKLKEWETNQKISKLNKEAKNEYDELKTALEGYQLQLEEVVAEQSREGISNANWQKLQDKGLVIDKQIYDAKVRMAEILASETSYIQEDTEAKKANEAARKKQIEDFWNEIEARQILNGLLHEQSLAEKYADKKLVKPELPEEEEDTTAEDALIELQNQYLAEEQLITIEEQKKLQIVKNALNEGVITEKYAQDLKTKITEEASEARKRIVEQEVQAQLLAVTLFLSSFASMFDSIGRMIGEESEEAFKANKAFQATAIVINTIAGAIGAYMGAVSNAGLNSIPFAGPAIALALGITNAIAVTGAGAAQLAELNRKKFGDSTLNGGSYTTSNAAITSTIIAPLLFSTAVQGAEINKNITDAKAYVTVEEINKVGKRVDVAETESRY